jgi:hypothetical protein
MEDDQMTDPIYAAIEHHRTALKASEAESSQVLLDAQGDALRDLLATAPTTKAGVFAAFEYFVGLGRDECLAPFAEKLRSSKVFEMEAPSPACPVAALLPEARQLIGAMEVFAEDMTPADSGERLRQERFQQAAHLFMDSLKDRASYLRAESALGALFQLAMIHDIANDLETAANDGRRYNDIEQAIYRMACSVATFIERSTGARREDACGDYYMSKRIDPHNTIKRALAFAEAAKEGA